MTTAHQLDKRRSYAAAALDLIDQEGVGALSMRTVADRADTSLGALQRSFASRQELLGATLEYSVERVTSRLAQLDLADADPRSVLGALVQATLPTTPQVLAECRVNDAFALLASHDDELARRLRAHDTDVNQIFAALLRDSGLDETEAATGATLLSAFIDGLAQRAGYDPALADQSAALATAFLECLLP